MENLPIDITHFLLFAIPGLITVWAFRYFTDSKKTGDFEYLGLSFFWGLVLAGFYAQIIPSPDTSLLANPYAASFGLSVVGFIGAFIVKAVIFLFKDVNSYGLTSKDIYNYLKNKDDFIINKNKKIVFKGEEKIK